MCMCVCVRTWMQHQVLQFVPVPESCEMLSIPSAPMAAAGTGSEQALSTAQDGGPGWWLRLVLLLPPHLHAAMEEYMAEKNK